MLGQVLKEKRKSQGLKLRELGSRLNIDQTLISRFERGDRLPTEVQLAGITDVLGMNYDDVHVEWLGEKVANLVKYSTRVPEVLSVAESRVEYLRRGEDEKVLVSASVQAKLKEVDRLKARWQAARPINKIQLERMHDYFDVSYTYESNRIEGNTLTLQETSLVLNEGLTIGGKSMREHLEVINHAEAIAFVRGLIENKESVNRRMLLEMHYLILKGIDRENAGKYRTVQVRISGSRHEPPEPFLLDKMMEDLFIHYELNRRQLHPVILAAEMHERLVSIHPFIDGNGRTARLLMNLILVSNGYTRANIKGDDKSRLAYYRALEAVQVDNDPEPFHHLVLDEVRRSLEEHLELV